MTLNSMQKAISNPVMVIWRILMKSINNQAILQCGGGGGVGTAAASRKQTRRNSAALTSNLIIVLVMAENRLYGNIDYL